MYTFKTYLLLEDIESKLPILVKQFGKIVTNTSNFPGGAQGMRSRIAPVAAEDAIQYIAKRADPTYPTAKYITWILQMIKGGSIRGEEDYDKTKSRLVQFERLKRIPNYIGSRDINQYKTYGELAHAINANLSVKSKGEQIRTAEMAGVDWIAEQGDWTMYLVNTPEAASKLFRETDWCIKDPKWFNQYKDKNFYYITQKQQKLYNDRSYGQDVMTLPSDVNVYDTPESPQLNKHIVELPMYLANFGSLQLKNPQDESFGTGPGESFHQPSEIDKILLTFFKPLPAYQEMKKNIANSGGSDYTSYITGDANTYCNEMYNEAEEDAEDNIAKGDLIERIMDLDTMMEWVGNNGGALIGPNEFYPILVADGVKVNRRVADGIDEEAYFDVFYHACQEWVKINL